MVKVTFVEHGGATHVVDVKPGYSLMEGAVANNIPGVIGECGGAMACGTCHVYVGPEWAGKVGAKSAAEEGMIETVLYTGEDSRLACQITVTEALEGLVVRVPESQY